ncbi:hypothetical protein CAPTEDRAFT_102528 [Capitella teleta]|uniref:DNA 3'-5' helicase n=1 Tax=Capitella teleta TaxID=283909 RepID=R7TF71_CAPTE|nr:hypothetical protein CAPTEDRAFT_102528 [Capitella teleta]|eukprot:ELT92384.1 hypothetical protein CAPTEDRAFT_102528 [Capitella teleta]
MKTVQAALSRESSAVVPAWAIRFIAVSATIPNVEDIADWLSTQAMRAVFHKMDESCRPVRLRKVVIGYPCSNTMNGFRFDLSLNYKLAQTIETYSDGKPTLVFCATRKGVQQAAALLAKEARFALSPEQRKKLTFEGNSLRDAKLKVSTSTLAMGVNLPAHLVIVKSTQHYVMGVYQEYTESQILQMIGRAGRPQFDNTATAVIMTKHQTKRKYDSLLNGTQLIESSLHAHLIEHLNAEIVLGTISDVSVAIEWLRSTFLYIRVMKNPQHYGTGRLMARYCIAFETMKNFHEIRGSETLQELLDVLCNSREFKDVQLRNNEKKVLNTLNKDPNRVTIRFQMKGKIKTNAMKVNCLLQAQFGCLSLQEFALQQDTAKIHRAALRVTKCLVEVLWQNACGYKALNNAVILAKCVKARLWENSKHLSRQLPGIGPTHANAMVNAGLITFQRIEESNPREIELVVNRHPPFGNHVRDAVKCLPKYELSIEQLNNYSATRADLNVTLKLTNADQVSINRHTIALLIGDADNRAIFKSKISDAQLVKSGSWSKKIEVRRAVKGEQLNVELISQDWAGLDVHSTYTPFYTGAKRITAGFPPKQTPTGSTGDFAERGKPCNHRCTNKAECGHECCKVGLREKPNAFQRYQQDIKHRIKQVRNQVKSLIGVCLHQCWSLREKPFIDCNFVSCCWILLFFFIILLSEKGGGGGGAWC